MAAKEPVAVLLQATPGASGEMDFLLDYALWFAAVLVVMVLALVLLKRARRLVSPEAPSVEQVSWDLDDLRRLRDSGEITIQQYESLRRQAIDAFTNKKGGAPP